MRLTTQIGDYEMDQVILDLGSNANILPKQTWGWMVKLVLQWSPIQLQMANQQKILPMGRLQGVTVDIDSVSTQTDFEVIEIVDNSNPYPTLLGIDWATDMKGIINLKGCKMTFEKKSLRVVVPLDPAERERYTEPIRDEESDDKLDFIYQITAKDQDQMHSTENRGTSWEHDSICTMDSEEEAERWRNRLQGVTTLNCNMMTRSVRRIATKERPHPEENGVIIEAQLGPPGTLCVIGEQPSVLKDK